MLLTSESSWLAAKPAKTNLKRQIIVAQKSTPFASKGKLCQHPSIKKQAIINVSDRAAQSAVVW